MNKRLPKEGGIYQILNLVNNKRYIGNAVSLRQRWWDHIKQLRKNKHSNQHLQNAFNLYGEENFFFNPIEFVEDKANLIEREDYWITQYDFDTELYNFCPKAISWLGMTHSEETKKLLSELNSGENNPHYGKKHSEETKKKMSKSRRARKISETQKEKMRLAKQNISQSTCIKISDANSIPCCQIDPKTNEIIAIYKGSSDAERITGINHGTISKVCKGEICYRGKKPYMPQTAGGYKWEYA